MARGHKIRERIHVLDGRKAVGCRWILKGRRTMMVNVTIKKARLVVKIFSDKFKELTMAPTPIEVEAYDSDHETSDQVTNKPHGMTRMRTTSEWYVILSWKSCC